LFNFPLFLFLSSPFLHSLTAVAHPDLLSHCAASRVSFKRELFICQREREEEEEKEFEASEITVELLGRSTTTVTVAVELSGCFGPEAQQMCKTVAEMGEGGPGCTQGSI
jgi:hypothetical protein